MTSFIYYSNRDEEFLDDYESLSVNDVIRRLSLSLKTNEDPLIIDVRRSHVLKDSLKEAKNYHQIQ